MFLISAIKRFHSFIHSYFRFQAAIFDFLLTPTNGSICISLVVLLDIKSIGIAVGILLLSFVLAQIYIISYLPPVPGRHL